MIPKRKIIRLKGQALLDLVTLVYERDRHQCVNCGEWVADGRKPHHEPCGAGRKSDELGKMALLCDKCHYERHHGANANLIKDKVLRYLEWMNDEI